MVVNCFHEIKYLKLPLLAQFPRKKPASTWFKNKIFNYKDIVWKKKIVMCLCYPKTDTPCSQIKIILTFFLQVK